MPSVVGCTWDAAAAPLARTRSAQDFGAALGEEVGTEARSVEGDVGWITVGSAAAVDSVVAGALEPAEPLAFSSETCRACHVSDGFRAFCGMLGMAGVTIGIAVRVGPRECAGTAGVARGVVRTAAVVEGVVGFVESASDGAWEVVGVVDPDTALA